MKKSVRGFSGGAGESAVTKKRGQRAKRLIERNFLTTEEKTEKFSFLYCEFYSEQKSSPKTSIVRKSIRKKQKVLREIFSTEKIAKKRNNLYIVYKTENKIVRIRGNRQGRGEGRQEKHGFSKMQTAKRRRRAAGNFFL